ncbi:MAG: hypothetical protein JNG90_14030 [Planctomycetaceae bacterium]|nr:hypothetical protein [Planctomycetaceae bacterium]
MSHFRLARGLTPLRQLLEFVICLVLTVTLFRTWHLENFVVPSGSMAPTLLGIHRDVACRDCGFAFPCGSGAVDGFPAAEARAVCPNCGSTENPLGALPDVAGARLLVSKQAFRVRAPRRWEIAVFRRPDVESKVFVKRIAGLPGESIQIRDGDVFAQGVIQRKSLAEQRAVAMVVHDSACVPDSLAASAERWHGDAARTLWQRDAGGYFHPAESATAADDQPTGPDVDWLTYRHWRRQPAPPGGVTEASVEDDCGYNQTRPVEEPAQIADLMLACRLRAFGRGELWLFATDGRDQFIAKIDPHGRRVRLEANGHEVAASTHAPASARALLSQATQVEFSLFDRQVLLAFDGELVLAPYEIPASVLPRTPTSRPLGVGSRGLGVELTELRVLRDIHYTHPRGLASRWALESPYQLGADEYFLLGDNSPLSDDSRFWPSGPAIPARLLVGKPLVVHLPSQQADLGWGPFNIPQFSAIRYIR